MASVSIINCFLTLYVLLLYLVDQVIIADNDIENVKGDPKETNRMFVIAA